MSRRCRVRLDGMSPTRRVRRVETELPGWACRIRTCKCHFGKCPLKCRADFAWFRNIWGPETFRAPAAKTPTCTFGWTGCVGDRIRTDLCLEFSDVRMFHAGA